MQELLDKFDKSCSLGMSTYGTTSGPNETPLASFPVLLAVSASGIYLLKSTEQGCIWSWEENESLERVQLLKAVKTKVGVAGNGA